QGGAEQPGYEPCLGIVEPRFRAWAPGKSGNIRLSGCAASPADALAAPLTGNRRAHRRRTPVRVRPSVQRVGSQYHRGATALPGDSLRLLRSLRPGKDLLRKRAFRRGRTVLGRSETGCEAYLLVGGSQAQKRAILEYRQKLRAAGASEQLEKARTRCILRLRGLHEEGRLYFSCNRRARLR